MFWKIKEPEIPTLQPQRPELWLMPTIVIATVAVVGAALIYFHNLKSINPVPPSILKSVAFSVYYPNPSKLPSGYSIDEKSFKSPNKQAVIYAVKYEQTKKLVFTVQQKPSDSEIAVFAKSYIPIHRDVLTLVGTAAVGAIGEQTVVSLPTDGNSWILITGPAVVDKSQLDQVLRAITKP